ncbi:hypothetical protein NFI96_019351 [Prochilodus magdalenae]|nr:hypothetical protein NFI96_019351 [Prochilodus magdalenae]
MATSVTTAAHGVQVVTHIIPLDESAPPCSSESKKSQEKSTLPYMTQMFLKGEPVALGTLQIFIGLVIIVMEIITLAARSLYEEFPLGFGISCIVCGSVTLAAHKGTSLRLIKSTLALNIIGILLALLGICYFCFEFATRSRLSDCIDLYGYWDCNSKAWQVTIFLDGLNGLQLVFSVLEMCVCITLVVFSCKARNLASVTNTVVRVQTSDPLCQSSHEALLTGDVLAWDSPPAYKP